MELALNHPIIAMQIAGLLGMATHWFKRWAQDQTNLGFRAFFRVHWKAALASVATLYGAVVGLLATGLVEATIQTLAMAYLAGFNLNSVFTPHKDQK